ncbi:MAG TPA: chromate transporter [Chloroflexia bacterium]|nr:chromate transporter [Chloroflexia bacterium]
MEDKEKEAPEAKLSYRDLFVIFFKAGLAFGGGLGILAVLEDELVTRRKVVSREDFLANYALGRIVPSGTMTALAVAYGYRFGRWFGTAITLTALVLPAFIITVVLTVAYNVIQGSPIFDLLPVTLLPAALALIVAAALKLGKDVFKPSLDFVLAALAFIGAYVFNLNTAVLLLAGGIIGIFLFRSNDSKKEAK